VSSGPLVPPQCSHVDLTLLSSGSKGDALSKAISNLVNATELAHNILSKNVESAAVQGSHVSPNRLADLRLQLQELDVAFLILERSHEGAEHPRLGQEYRLAFTQAQCVQCLTHLLRVAYGTEDVSHSLQVSFPGNAHSHSLCQSILTDDSPLLDLIWLHCPYFEIFSLERELFLKSLPEGSTWGSTLEAVSEAKWNDRRVPSKLRSVINSSITRDRINHQNSLRERRTKYSKVYRETLFNNWQNFSDWRVLLRYVFDFDSLSRPSSALTHVVP